MFFVINELVALKTIAERTDLGGIKNEATCLSAGVLAILWEHVSFYGSFPELSIMRRGHPSIIEDLQLPYPLSVSG